MAVTYPTNLSVGRIVGYRNTDLSGNVVYKTEIGPPRIVKQFDDRPSKFRVQWILKPLEFQVFEGFYKYDLKFGSLTFDMNLKIGAGLVSHELLFTAPYKASLEGLLWMVEAELITLVKQRDDLATYQAAKDSIAPPPEFPTGTIAFWKFETAGDPTADETGNHPLTSFSGGTIAFDTGYNDVGTCLHVDGGPSVQYYVAQPSTDWDLNDYTIIFSVKITAESGSNLQGVIMSQVDRFLTMLGPNVTYDHTFRSFRLSNNSLGLSVESRGFTPDFDTWYRIAMLWDSNGGDSNNGGGICYVDGVERDTANMPTSPGYFPNSRIAIGSYYDRSDSYLRGMVDEVLIVGRAMTAQEILDDYNSYQ